MSAEETFEQRREYSAFPVVQAQQYHAAWS